MNPGWTSIWEMISSGSEKARKLDLQYEYVRVTSVPSIHGIAQGDRRDRRLVRNMYMKQNWTKERHFIVPLIRARRADCDLYPKRDTI